MALGAPRICCLDLDTFFVSVERRLDPRLMGKPVVVGGLPGQRGVVTACSYEVRALGVRSGMSLTRAVQLAPDAIYLPTRHGVYGHYAARVRTIAAQYTPIMQIASIDELFLDFSGCEALYRSPADPDDDATITRVVRQLTHEILCQTGLPASAGIATSRSLAKVTCGLAKPAGVRLVPAGSEAELLAPLPVRKFPGIGKVAEQKLQALGVTTLGQLVAAEPALLRRVFGSHTARMQAACRGQGGHLLGPERPAFQEFDPAGGARGTLSNERTFRSDVRDPERIEATLSALCERVCWRARKRGVKARTVAIKLRYADFETLSRARSITPTCSELELYPIILELFAQARTRRTPVRLLGVCLSNLRPWDEQLSLFDDNEPLHRTVDDVRRKFGFDALRIAHAAPHDD